MTKQNYAINYLISNQRRYFLIYTIADHGVQNEAVEGL